MRDVAVTVSEFAAALPMASVTTYLGLLDLAMANDMLDAAVHDMTVDALVNHWSKDDPRWNLLPGAALHFR